MSDYCDGSEDYLFRYSHHVECVEGVLLGSVGRLDHSDHKLGVFNMLSVSDITPCVVYPEDKRACGLLNVTFSQSEGEVTILDSI